MCSSDITSVRRRWQSSSVFQLDSIPRVLYFVDMAAYPPISQLSHPESRAKQEAIVELLVMFSYPPKIHKRKQQKVRLKNPTSRAIKGTKWLF